MLICAIYCSNTPGHCIRDFTHAQRTRTRTQQEDNTTRAQRNLKCRSRARPTFNKLDADRTVPALLGEDERNDEAIEAQGLGEDQDEDHDDEELLLLAHSAHTGVAHHTNRHAGARTYSTTRTVTGYSHGSSYSGSAYASSDGYAHGDAYYDDSYYEGDAYYEAYPAPSAGYAAELSLDREDPWNGYRR